MTATEEVRAPLADAVAPDLGDSPMYPLIGTHPGSEPVRSRMDEALEVALRSPRWDQVRGLILLASVTVVGAALALLFAVAFLTGAVLLFRTMWEVW